MKTRLVMACIAAATSTARMLGAVNMPPPLLYPLTHASARAWCESCVSSVLTHTLASITTAALGGNV